MASTKFKSVADMFLSRVRSTPDKDAFYFPDAAEKWHTISWRQVDGRVRGIAGGLIDLGMGDETRVAILSSTRVEWILADLGINVGGGACTTIYPSNTPEECAYIINDSNTKIVIAEDDGQVKKLLGKRAEMPGLKHIVVMNGAAGSDGFVLTLADLEKKGAAWNSANAGKLDQIAAAITPNRLATLIYTSGTTGVPKGVELTHDCWVFEGEAIEALPLNGDDKQFLWLPMAHSFGKVLEVAILQIGIATAVDGRIPKVIDNLGIVKPTFMAAPPRIFEKVYNKVVTGAEESGGAKLKIFQWAISVGKEVSALRQQKKEPSGLLAIKLAIADRLVFSKLRERFGGRIRFFVSGSAPLSRDMAEFFHACGILILEGYGLTETSAASFVNLPEFFKFGTVGKPLPGVKVKIAGDGEILIGGRGVMRGYHNKADVSAETLQDGWLLTGDIGELDNEGRLRITDRKKDLIKTSGGKYVAPQALESKLKALCPYLSQVVVHGNNRNFCTAVVTLDPEAAPKWATEHGISDNSIPALAKNAQVIALVQTAVDTLNKGVGSWESIKKFAILPADLTQEAGELTPSLKVKRKAVEQKYAAIFEGFYAGALRDVG